jgi:hypothetical protein
MPLASWVDEASRMPPVVGRTASMLVLTERSPGSGAPAGNLTRPYSFCASGRSISNENRVPCPDVVTQRSPPKESTS